MLEGTRHANQKKDALASIENRRFHKRAILTTAIDLESDFPKCSGYTRDISEGGVFVVTDRPFQLGDPLALKLNVICGEVMEIRCRVAWVQHHTENGKQINTGVGLQFVRLPEKAREAIVHFVETGDASTLMFHTDEDSGFISTLDSESDLELSDDRFEMVPI